jgi:plasmid stabilization system protein ParE
MPSWSSKQERKYEHIKEGYKQRGASERRAKEIAGRTVNKDRREKGQTPNKTTQGTGNPNQKLESRSKNELYNIAKDRDIPGRSKMDKQELIRHIRKGS